MNQRSDGLTLISIYHFVSGILNLLVLCGVLAVPFIVGVSTAAANDPDGATATAIVGIIGLFVGAIFLLLAAVNVAVGWGLWQRREWSRLAAMGLSVVRLLNIPLGTIVGALIIWYLLREDVVAEFSR